MASDGDGGEDYDGGDGRRHGEALAEQRPAPQDRQHRLGKLELASLGDAGPGQAGIPGEERKEHRHCGCVAERRPLTSGGVELASGGDSPSGRADGERGR